MDFIVENAIKASAKLEMPEKHKMKKSLKHQK